jgi:hypothetical protein
MPALPAAGNDGLLRIHRTKTARIDVKGSEVVELIRRAVLAEHDAALERAQADRWQFLAEHYDDIRYALRNCDDTPEGHTEFYNEAARIIFGGD